MNPFILSLEQQAWLRCELKQPTNAQSYRRAAALLAMNEGRSATDVADLLGVTRQTVYNWVNSYGDATSVANLEDAPRPGRPSVWTKASDLVLCQALERSPQDFGYLERRWSTTLLQTHLDSSLGRQVSAETIRRKLRRLGYGRNGESVASQAPMQPTKEVLCAPGQNTPSSRSPFADRNAIAA